LPTIILDREGVCCASCGIEGVTPSKAANFS
jgi:hypothetical protein